ncbi:MAG TPA: DNA (cytosine-5-)-methyltransferase [Candidatus Absconditabacterales bacterium]|nr:DNA (cytosine-5-)-methyltransferase [Candidatus Absconditabacterales bacterium]
MTNFTFVDLFAGIGGFHKAFHELGGVCVAVSENDKYARITYEENFKHISPDVFANGYFYGDIRKIESNQLPKHTIMCGGFPCQAFSIAGYQKGFQDDRGNLFFDVARLANDLKPDVLFLENVKNLKSHDNGNTIKVILETMKEIGYHVHMKVLNSCEYGGIPQNRERVYIVGFRNKKHFDRFEFPEPIALEKSVNSILINEKVDDKYYYNGKNLYDRIKDEVKKKNTFYQRRRQYVRENKSGVCPTLTANMGTGGHNVPIILDDYGIRKLTPKETFMLQGFGNDYILPNIGDSQLYKQAGNAVTVNTVYRVAKQILIASEII